MQAGHYPRHAGRVSGRTPSGKTRAGRRTPARSKAAAPRRDGPVPAAGRGLAVGRKHGTPPRGIGSALMVEPMLAPSNFLSDFYPASREPGWPGMGCGPMCGGEQRRAGGGARSALRQLTRRACPSGATQSRSELRDAPPARAAQRSRPAGPTAKPRPAAHAGPPRLSAGTPARNRTPNAERRTKNEERRTTEPRNAAPPDRLALTPCGRSSPARSPSTRPGSRRPSGARSRR
jgi:hypothetical protein